MELKVEFTPEAQAALQEKFKFVLEAAGQKAVEAAVERAPARGEGPYATGLMRERIRGQMTGDNEFTLFCPAGHGIFVEFGTGPKGQVSGAWPDFPDDPQPSMHYHNGEVLVTRAGGHMLDQPYIRHTQGMYASPFMRPALLEGVKWIKKLLEDMS